MTKYSKKAHAKVKTVMREYKQGKLKSGKSDKPVTNRKQAVAIGLSEARKHGYKAPAAPGKSKSSSKSRTSARKTKTSRRRASTRKTAR